MYSAEVDLGGSGMARRANGTKMDAIINYVLQLMDQVHTSLPGVDTASLDAVPPAPGTILDLAMGSISPPSESPLMGKGVGPEQRAELRSISKDCINRLQILHTSAASTVTGVPMSGAVASTGRKEDSRERKWTTFHDQDGISISEYCGSDSPFGTLMASCHVDVSLICFFYYLFLSRLSLSYYYLFLIFYLLHGIYIGYAPNCEKTIGGVS